MSGRRSEEAPADCTGGLSRNKQRSRTAGRGGSLVGWLVRIQKLFREGVDLVGPSDFVRQQR